MDYHFTKEEAIKYGVEAAIILYNLKFWIIKNKANNKNFMDGHYWTYNSCNAFMQMFPFWSKQKIWRILRELEEAGIIKSKNFNTNKMNQSKWYCFVDENFINDIQADPDTDQDQKQEETDVSNLKVASFKNETCKLQKQNLHLTKMKNAFNKNEKSVYNMYTDNKLTDNKQKIDIPEQKTVPDYPKQAELLPATETEKPKKLSKPKVKDPNTPQARMVAYFATKYQQMTGIPYKAINNDYSTLAKYIADYGIELVKQKIDWLAVGCTHPKVYWFAKDVNNFLIGTLHSHWNEILPVLTDEQRKQKEKLRKEQETKRAVEAELAKQGITLKPEPKQNSIIPSR